MKKEISGSRFYKIVAKILPNIIVSAQIYTGKENKKRKQEIKRLKAELKSIKPRQDNNDLSNDKGKDMKTTLEVKEVKKVHHSSTHLSLDKDAIEQVKKSTVFKTPTPGK